MEKEVNISVNKSFSYDELTDWKTDLADAFTALHRSTVDVLTESEKDCISRCLCELNRRLNDDSKAWLDAGQAKRN